MMLSLFWVWCKIRIQFHYIACVYPVFSTPFVKESIISPLCILGALLKNHLTVEWSEKDGGVGKHWAHLPLTNTSKLQLHLEWLSLKLTWGLEGQLFYKQGCKERFTQSRVGRKVKQSGWDLHPQWGTQKRKGISQAWESSLGSKGFEPHIRHASPVVQHWEDKPLS